MKNVYIYAIALFSGVICLIASDLYKLNYRKDYHFYLSDWTYENSEPNDIGILVDKTNHKITYFTVIGRTYDHRLCIRFGTDTKAIDLSDLGKKRYTKEGVEIHTSEYWLSDLFENKKVWSKELSVISQSDITELTDKNNVYYYTRPIGSVDYPKNMVIIFFRLINLLGMYLAIYILIFVYHVLKKKSFRFANVWIWCLLLCTSLFITYLYASDRWWSLIFNIQLIKNLISFYVLWFLLKWSNKRLEQIDFGKKELIKFCIIALFGLVVEYFGGHIADYIYFNLIEGNKFNRFSMFSNVLGWYALWIYFGIANFMSNLTFYIVDLRKREKSFQQQQYEGSFTTSTLASIQSRINPHFLYNALNSIASLARTEPKKTEEMALQLAKFYGQCRYIKSTPLITLTEELEILKSYLMIEKIRFGDRLQVSLPKDSDVTDVIIPSFTLQPIVENAIKYGYNTAENVIHIRITAEKNEKSLILRVYDSGPPFSDDMQSGYGLSSIVQKLKVLYPNRHTISYINESEKCVEIMLDVMP